MSFSKERADLASKLLFDSLRLITVEPADTETLDPENCCKAVKAARALRETDNIMLPADDIILLAKVPDIEAAVAQVHSYLQKAEARSDLVFWSPEQSRLVSDDLHYLMQAMHYASTYGVEALTGQPVFRGILPSDFLERVQLGDKSEKPLVKEQVYRLSTLEEGLQQALNKLFKENRRASTSDMELGVLALEFFGPDILAGRQMAFKENLTRLFEKILDSDMESKAKVRIVQGLCAHPGDVLKCADSFLQSKNRLQPHKYRLTTAQKRVIVRALEGYSEASLLENFCRSQKERERALFILRHLNPTRFARSSTLLEVLDKVKNKEVRSWESKYQKLLLNRPNEAALYAASRPGFLMRSLVSLQRNGASPHLLKELVKQNADSITSRMLVELAGTMQVRALSPDLVTEHGGPQTPAEIWCERYIAREVAILARDVLKERMETWDTPLKGKKVFFDAGGADVEHSMVSPSSPESGYIRPGLAFAIPEEASLVRFFCYWNDSRRVDIDLHSQVLFDSDGELKAETVGWYSNRTLKGVGFSGDITHSDAAEFVDIDLATAEEEGVVGVSTSICSYTDQPFSDIDTCFTGLMPIKELNDKLALYDQRNCWFSHDLKAPVVQEQYALVDVKNRVVRLLSFKEDNPYEPAPPVHTQNGAEADLEATVLRACGGMISLKRYLDMLAAGQQITWVSTPEEADMTLYLLKPETEDSVSLTDVNFYLDN